MIVVWEHELTYMRPAHAARDYTTPLRVPAPILGRLACLPVDMTDIIMMTILIEGGEM